MDPEADADFVARVSTLPVFSTALRAYEQSKASSRVVKVIPTPFFHLLCVKMLIFVDLVWRGDDGVFREEHIAARHRPITGHITRRVCMSATRPGTSHSLFPFSLFPSLRPLSFRLRLVWV